MAFARNSDAAGIVALALAFHHAPARYPELLHGRTPLPPGVGTLLKLAGGSAAEPGHAALAAPGELRAAALFFIEQVLFRHGASHYRLLGLEPGASLDQIKEHHHLLMRVFHPDRENWADDWRDAFATRINLAYTALRDPDTRRRYDASLAQAARAGKAPSGNAVPQAKRRVPRVRTGWAPPWLWHYLPQWVLAGTALVAFVGVGAVYLNNAAGPASSGAQVVASIQSSRGGEAAEPAAKGEPVAAAIPPSIAAAGEAHAAPIARPAPAAAEPTPSPPAAEAAPREHARPSERAKVQPAAVPAAASARPPVAAAPAPATPALPGTSALPAPAAQPVPPAAVAARPAQVDPGVVLAAFMSSYERGDTQAFMALFDDVAVSPAGGKPQIRLEHEALFRATDLRHLAIDRMAWSRDGNMIHGVGHYQKTLMRKGELRLQNESGIFHIELVQRGDEARIIELDYSPRERS